MLNKPRTIKYKKTRKGKLGHLEYKANSLTFGDIGLKATEPGILTSKQIEAARQAIVRKTKRQGKVWIKVFPDTPNTANQLALEWGRVKETFHIG